MFITCRSRELEEACFLNFSVKLFLDDKLDKLSQFKKDLEMCETADENCSIVQKYLEDFSKVLEKDSMWQCELISILIATFLMVLLLFV